MEDLLYSLYLNILTTLVMKWCTQTMKSHRHHHVECVLSVIHRQLTSYRLIIDKRQTLIKQDTLTFLLEFDQFAMQHVVANNFPDF